MTRTGSFMQYRKIWLAVLLVGILLRIAFVWRPVDYRLLNSWRECDYAAVARSFSVEDMNILYPRVDWRGDTPGIAEMELPLVPWLASLASLLFGHRDELLRVISALFGIVALFVFDALARRTLPPKGAVAATALFAANGLLIALSGAAQPESVMLLFSILAVYMMVRWMESGKTSDLSVAAAVAALAILAKSPAAYLGFVFAFIVLRRLGLRAFSTPAVYGAALVATVPPLLWYWWAHQNYLVTGLSLGLSNETHWLSWTMVLNPWDWIRGNLIAEARDVFAVSGIVLAGGALASSWKKIEIPLIWCASLLVFYVVAADTAGDMWAYYYHSMSIAPACLLMGSGFLVLSSSPKTALAILCMTLIATLARGVQLQYRTLTSPALKPLYECSLQFRDHVPPTEKIMVRGGRRTDAHGHPVAYNTSMVFAWMDRRGFNYPVEAYNWQTLDSLSRRGARFWVAQPDDFTDSTATAEILRHVVPVARCGSLTLYDLGQPMSIQP